MKKILHFIGYLGRGGDTSVVMQIMNHGGEDFHFDFVTHQPRADEEYVKKMRSMGSTVYVLPGDMRTLGPVHYLWTVHKLLRKIASQYDAIHVHTGLQGGLVLLAAKWNGIKIRISHAHTTDLQNKTNHLLKKTITPILRKLVISNSTCRVACSSAAGRFLFGNADFRCIYNGVNTKLYHAVEMDDIERAKRELGIQENDLIVGHVANFGLMKNHVFDLEIARRSQNSRVRFLIVGKGTNYDYIVHAAEGLGNKIIFTGQRSDVPTLLYCCDTVILPSLPGEGFPVSMIEAQAAGCNVVVSENVTSEADIGVGLFRQIRLDDIFEWVKTIDQLSPNRDYMTRRERLKQIEQLGFDTEHFYHQWISIYS